MVPMTGSEWTKEKNERRCYLLNVEHVTRGELSPEGREELTHLQAQFTAYLASLYTHKKDKVSG